jgi:hypothetical protein
MSDRVWKLLIFLILAPAIIPLVVCLWLHLLIWAMPVLLALALIAGFAAGISAAIATGAGAPHPRWRRVGPVIPPSRPLGGYRVKRPRGVRDRR